jgi:glycosyltransferase involved in cell wall biosynthesis
VLGYVPPEQRLATYERAAVLVMPSHHEGFGIPALEAMTLGVPVIAADRGALPEVTGDAALLFDPDDAGALTAALDRVLGDDGLRASMRERGWRRAAEYSAEAAAAATREAWTLALEARQRRLAGRVRG